MNNLTFRVFLGFSAAVAAGVIVSAVVIFLAGIGYLGLRSVVSPTAAVAVTSVGALAIAAAIFCGSRQVLRFLSQRRTPSPYPDEKHLAKQLESLLGAEVVALIETHPRTSAASALLAGVIVGACPNVRKFLRQLF